MTDLISRGLAKSNQDKIGILSSVTISIVNFPRAFSETDDTARIKRALSYIETLGGGTLIFPSGSYSVTATSTNQNAISLKSNCSLEGKGNVVIQLNANNLTNYSIIDIRSVNNTSVRNIKIIGDRDTHIGTTGEWGMGVNIIESSNVILDKVISEKCWGDGLYLGCLTFTPSVHNTNIKITNCEFQGRRNAVSVIDLQKGVFDKCIFRDTSGVLPKAGVDFEPNSASQLIEDVRFINCEFKDNTNALVSANVNGNVKNIRVIDCDFKNGETHMSLGGTTSPIYDIKVRGCTFENFMIGGNKNNAEPAGGLRGAENVLMDGNIFKNCGKFTIRTSNNGILSKRIKIFRSELTDSVGFEVRSGDSIKIKDAEINNFTNFGVFINKIDTVQTQNIFIDSIEINGSAGGSSIASGVRIDAGDDVSVQNVTCRKDSGDLMKRGIYVAAASGYVKLINNDCKNGGADNGIINSAAGTYLRNNRMKDGTFTDTPN
ncbi:hypothetical protein [Priestia megaterium]|uniref:hypothetical protein n=1 Tax=Priestia megaterium TaxID=1404 RepID=UPI003CC56BD0